MGAKDGQHIHVLLGMVKLVEPPEHSDTMICEMHSPVASVHRHDDDGDGNPARHRVQVGQDDPREEAANGFGEGQRQRRHQRKHQCRVDHRDQEVMTVAAGEERPLLRRPYPFHHQNDSDDRDRQGPDDGETQARQGPGERRATPAAGPSDSHEYRSHDRNGEGGEVHPRRQHNAPLSYGGTGPHRPGGNRLLGWKENGCHDRDPASNLGTRTRLPPFPRLTSASLRSWSSSGRSRRRTTCPTCR